MTYKEERFAIVKSPCCIHNKKTVFKNAMTRAEAVYRMAKANWIAVVCWKNKSTPDYVSQKEWEAGWIELPKIIKKVYFDGAKAALDALLGGKK